MLWLQPIGDRETFILTLFLYWEMGAVLVSMLQPNGSSYPTCYTATVQSTKGNKLKHRNPMENEWIFHDEKYVNRYLVNNLVADMHSHTKRDELNKNL